jgi:hypothetical protein
MPRFKKTTAKTLSAHLRAFADYVDEHEKPEGKKELASWLNEKLDELLSEDAFGTEGQCDPRGDHRD